MKKIFGNTDNEEYVIKEAEGVVHVANSKYTQELFFVAPFYHREIPEEMEKLILEGKQDRNHIIYGKGRDNFYGCICDAFAMAVSIEPEIVTDCQSDQCVMELDGHMTRGQMVVIRSKCWLDAWVGKKYRVFRAKFYEKNHNNEFRAG